MAKVVIQKALVQGLRPDGANINADFLEQCDNLRCYEQGLGQPPTVHYAEVVSSPSQSFSHPHPQILPGAQGQVFLFGATSLYSLDLSGSLPAAAIAMPLSSAKLGADVVGNGDFSTTTGWTTTGWTVANGRATHNTGNTSSLTKSCLVSGHTYEISFRIFGGTAGGVVPKAGTTAGASTSFTGVNRVWLVTAGSSILSFVPSSDFDGAISNIVVKEVSSATVEAGGGVWQLAAFRRDLFWATNGVATVFRIPSNPQDGSGSTTTSVEKIADGFSCQAVLAHGASLVMGGLDLSGLDATRLARVFSAWRTSGYGSDDPRAALVSFAGQQFDVDWVFISGEGIDSSSHPGALLMAMLQVPDLDRYDRLEEAVLQAFEDGRIQAVPLFDTGAVRVAISFGEEILIFGKSGLSFLSPKPTGYVESSVAVDGIPSRGAACAGMGGESPEAVFVTNQGELYIAGSDASARYPWAKHVKGATHAYARHPVYRLGYREFLSNMTLANIVITHDPVEQAYFISDGVHCYSLTRTGLYSCPRVLPSSLCRIGKYNGLVGTFGTGSNVATIATGMFDGGVKGMKNMLFIRAATAPTSADQWQAYFGYRRNISDTAQRSGPYSVDPRGFSRGAQEGLEHQVVLTASDSTLVDMDYIEVELVSKGENGKPRLRSIMS